MTAETDILIRTKLHRPQLPGDLVARPMLLEWLSQHRRRPLTLVSASAGYGKTTLVSSWLETVESPSAWLSLDEHDDDLVVFLTYFIAALQTICPEAGWETQGLLTAPNMPPVPVLARSLINELARLTDPFILVLDDYHLIREATIHDLLSELLRHPLRAMHLVIATRSDPPLPIYKLRARAQVTEIRLQELRFRAAETTTFLQRLGIRADDITTESLTQKTEGWVTGLRLAALSLRHRGDIDLLLKGMPENSRYVTDYLLAEVLNRLDPAIQDFLLKTSILDRLCGSLCDAVTGLDEPECHGQAYLAWLYEQNLFTIPLDDQHYWYRYHHLFQQLLQHRLRLKLDSEAIASLHRRTSSWYANKGLIDEALHHALKGGDLTAAADLVERNGPTLLDEDKWKILEKWLLQLPDEIIQQRPKLLIARVWVLYYRFALLAIPPLLETIETSLGDDEITQPLQGEVDFFWGFHWYWQGQTTRSLDLLHRATERISTAHHGPRGEAELFWSLASQMSGHKNDAIRALDQWRYYGETLHPVRQVRLEGALIFIHLLCGDLAAAARVIQQFQITAAKGNDTYAKAWGAYLQAHIYFCRNDLENAADQLAQAVEKRYVLHTKAAIDSLAGLALTYQALGQPESAGEALTLLLEFALETNIPAYLTVAYSCRARLSLLQGEMPSALDWRHTATVATDAGPMFYWLEIPRITQCRVLIAQGTEAGLQQALELLQDYRQEVEAQHNTRQLIDILVLQALVYHKRDQFDDALTTLEQAVNLGRPGGFIRPFVEPGAELADPLVRLRSQGVAPNFIGQILAAFGLKDERSRTVSPPLTTVFPGPASSLIEPLTDRELDVLQLLAQRFSRKEIASELLISPLTVKSHTANIYQKLGVKNRRQAVSRAAALGLVSEK